MLETKITNKTEIKDIHKWIVNRFVKWIDTSSTNLTKIGFWDGKVLLIEKEMIGWGVYSDVFYEETP